MVDGSTLQTPTQDSRQLLSADEPGPFKVLNALSKQPILLICDHASRRFPASLGDMGNAKQQ